MCTSFLEGWGPPAVRGSRWPHFRLHAPPCPLRVTRTSRLVANREGTGKIIAHGPRLWSAVLGLMQDPSIGDLILQLADDPDMTYHLWEMKFHRNGGGRTAPCLDGFEIIIDLEYHLSTEGTACGNPLGSGSIESLLAHELGHAWTWRWYGLDEDCDNRSIGSIMSVAWENTQLKNGARRLVHAKPGCGCD